MASEYLKQKYKDVQPDVQKVYTPAEKRKLWWQYNKFFVLLGAAAVLLFGNFMYHVLGFGTVKPDCQIAYVGTYSLPDEAAQALQDRFAALIQDANGDGQVLVQINQYITLSKDDVDASYYTQAAQAQLIADISTCQSYFFLMEDGAGFQKNMHVLRKLDGSLPEDEDFDDAWVNLSELPGLAGLVSENEAALSSLQLGRRGFWTEKRTDNEAACDALWEQLLG